MPRNMPPLSGPQKRKWNQMMHQTGPDWGCTEECGWVGMMDELDHGCACPSCGNEELVRL